MYRRNERTRTCERRALAADGASVAVCGRTPEHVDEARNRLEAVGDGDVLAVEADITDPDQIEALVEATVDSFGGLDHVVTAPAAVPPDGSGDDRATSGTAPTTCS